MPDESENLTQVLNEIGHIICRCKPIGLIVILTHNEQICVESQLSPHVHICKLVMLMSVSQRQLSYLKISMTIC